MSVPEKPNPRETSWLWDERLKALLRAKRAIAFEFDPATRRETASPGIDDHIAGNFDGRFLSEVMLDGEITHPDDREKSIRFREQAMAGAEGEITLRLMTPSGEYRWFNLALTSCQKDGKRLLIGVFSDVDEEMRMKERLRYRAEYDAVSGIYNKETFFEATRKLLEREPGRPHYLIRFDIDRFKIVNELYSVSEGDLLLRHVGKVLRELVCPGETYARMGDDVFCACLTRKEAEVIGFTEQLTRRVNEYPLPFQFMVSAGIMPIPHYDGQPVNILCDRAALAQRRVKGSCLHQYAFYERWMSEALSREHYITGCMHDALKQGQFKVYFQPKVDMRTGLISGAEALARWTHPSAGAIQPGEFIPLFEKNGFILQLDEYVWELTCRRLRKWLGTGIDPPPISVNVSRVHLYDPDFCGKLLRLVKDYGLPPGLLELEITESAYVDSPQTLYKIMEHLQTEGFIFAMDDFGSGYSSLNALKDIPVNVVKIDLHFLRDARMGEAAGRGILRGTIRLLRDMGLPVIAEGVETREQVDLLLGMGCTHAQGYYYARPMPADEFEKRLLRPDG